MADLLIKKKQVVVTINGNDFKVKKSLVEMHKEAVKLQNKAMKLNQNEDVASESLKIVEKLENLIKSAIGEDSLEKIGNGESLDFNELTQIYAHIIKVLGESQKKGISDFVKNYE